LNNSKNRMFSTIRNLVAESESLIEQIKKKNLQTSTADNLIPILHFK